MFDNITLDKWLQKKDIVPSDSRVYKFDDINDAIVSQLKHQVQIQCVTKKNTQPILDSVNVCFNNKNLTLIDCPKTTAKNCGKGFVSYKPLQK